MYVIQLQSRPDLEPWHTIELEGEFTRDNGITSLSDYLDLEQRLFQQLEARLLAKIPGGPDQHTNRFSQGSARDPNGRSPN